MKIAATLVGLLLLGIGYFAFLAWKSQSPGKPVGLVDGQLRPCPKTPNCVSSLAPDPEQAVEALRLDDADPAQAWQLFIGVVRAEGGRIEEQSDGYLWATFRTPLLRYVDDLEAHLDPADGTIAVRSASRVGHSDLGKNRERVEQLRAALIQALKHTGP